MENWNYLKIFRSVAANGSLSRAADELYLSHTTVFRHLKAFEKEMGTRLFETIKGEYQLTETGKELLLLVENVSGTIHEIDRKMTGKDFHPQGKIKLTATTSFSYYSLPIHLKKFKELHPDIQVELIVTNQEINMADRSADIALRVANFPPENLVGRKIGKLKWGVYAGQKYLEHAQKPTCLNDLENHKLIGASGFFQTHRAFKWLDKKYSNNIIQRTDDLVAMSSFAECGMGLAFLSDDLKRPSLERCFTFEPAHYKHLWVLTHPDLRHVERIKTLMNFLANSFAKDIFFNLPSQATP